MRITSVPEPSNPSPNSAYRPSVPISVYRELSAELEASKAMLDSLHTQNQQLTQHNQILRQEITKVVQTAMQLQQVVDSLQGATPGAAVNSMPHAMPSSLPAYPEVSLEMPLPPPPPSPNQDSGETTSKRRPASRKASPKDSQKPENITPSPDLSPVSVDFEELVIEQEEGRYRRPVQPERVSEVNGLWLVVVIFLIVATAFGTGFLIVRPLLNSR